MNSSSVSTASLRDLMQQRAIGRGQLDGDQVSSDVYAQAPRIVQMPSDDEIINAAGPEHGEAILNAHRDMQEARADVQNAQLKYFGETAAAIKASNYDPNVADILLQHAAGEPEFADQVDQIRELVRQNPQALKPIVDNAIQTTAKPGSSQGMEGQQNSGAGPGSSGDDQKTAPAQNGGAPGQVSLADLMTQPEFGDRQGGPNPDASDGNSPIVDPSKQPRPSPQQPQQGRHPERKPSPQQPLPPPPLPSPPRTPIDGIRGMVADVARSKTNSEDYLVAKSKGNFGPGSDKCNLLVADIIEESGLPRPQVPYKNEGVKGTISNAMGRLREPDANEWANPKVVIPGWSEPRPLSEARPGDVIAQQHGNGGHAGMIVWNAKKNRLLTVSVNTADKIPGLVTQNPWGFRDPPYNGESKDDPAPVVRHYTGK